MTIEQLQQTISNLEKLLAQSSGKDKLELNRTIFDLKNKKANQITSALDKLSINITEEDLDQLSKAANVISEATTTATEKSELVKKGIGIGKTILGFIK